MGMVFEHYPAGGGEMLTLLKLADNADDLGSHIFPSIARIAAMTWQSERQVQRHIAAIRKRGWLVLVKRGGKGPGDTTSYRVPMDRIQRQLVGKGDKMSPIELRVTSGPEKGDIQGPKGDTAMSPESSLEPPVKNRQIAGAALQPGAVAACFTRYQRGIKTKTGVDYPPSAKANGQLSQLVKRVGAEHAPAVVDFYLTSSNPFYAKTGWKLDFLVRDAEQLYMAMRQRAAGAEETPAEVAEVSVLCADDRTMALQDYPIDEPMRVARRAGQEYAKLLTQKRAHSIAVKIGSQRSVFKIEELWA